ncbi:MAG TPA: hypothetical protein VMU02_06775 [bacterium]|nr:hypothetical protein [bacterium]
MERKPRNLGRAYLVKELGRRGLSRRDAVYILSVVFDEMSQALKRGEVVEFPPGRLRRVLRSMGELDRPADRRRYKVKWEPDGEDWLTEEADGAFEQALKEGWHPRPGWSESSSEIGK